MIRSMKEHSILRKGCLFLILFSLWGHPGSAQQDSPDETGLAGGPEDREGEREVLASTFREAEVLFNSADQSLSIPLMEKFITATAEQKTRRGLSEFEQTMLWKALDYLGQALFNEGQLDGSRNAFRKMLEFNPNYRQDEVLVSPKIIGFVNAIRSREWCTITVNCDPSGAAVRLDGVLVGILCPVTFYAWKGDHLLEVSRPGFGPKEEPITVLPGKSQSFDVKLERASSVAYLVTYPKGVEIWMNGGKVGETGGDPSQRALAKAAELNLPFSDFSSELPVPDLQPGTQEIEFRKPCWETMIRRIVVEGLDDLFFEPVALLPSHGFLDIRADDLEAKIFLDDEYVGVGPEQRLEVCTGQHVLMLKGPRGKYQKTIEIEKDQTLTIAAKLNPCLAFLGLLATPGILESELEKVRVQTQGQISSLQNLAVVDHSTSPEITSLEPLLRQILEEIDSSGPQKERMDKIREICTEVESDLLLVGRVHGEFLRRTVHFYLLSSLSSMADIRVLDALDAKQWDRFKASLEFEQPLFEKRMGVHLVDSLVTPGPVVSQALLKAPGEAEALQRGDILTGISGNPVKSAVEAEEVIRRCQELERVQVTFLRSGTQHEMDLKLVESLLELQLGNPFLLFNRQLVSLKRAGASSKDSLTRNAALLNMGLCYLHFSEHDLAFDQLRQVQLDRPVGIGRGTVQYRIAQCYLELGYLKEAREALQKAAQYPQNTLDADDGLPLLREIQRAMLCLQ